MRQSCDSYCMQKNCKWQLLYALLQLTTLFVLLLLTIFVCMAFSVCTIAIDTFLYALLYTLITFIFTIANNHSFHMYYSHWKIVHKLLQVTTFVYKIAINNFCIHCYIWQPQLSTFSSISLHYYNCWFILILLQSTTCVCIIAVVNFCMHHFKWQLMYALLYLTTFLCTIAIKFARIVAIEESNIKTIRNIDYNNMNNLITTI